MQIRWKALATVVALIGGAVALNGCYYDPYYGGGYYTPTPVYNPPVYYGPRPYYGRPYRRW